MNRSIYSDYLDKWTQETPDDVWLRDRAGDRITEWTWKQARAEIDAAAAWLEDRFGSGVNMAVLSRNRAHWFLADLGVITSGNVTIPLFTTLPAATAKYVLDFSETKVLFLGEAENAEAVLEVLPEGATIVCFPGVEVDAPHVHWDDIVEEAAGARPRYRADPKDIVSLVFTSGTTGAPKGVIQTHESMLIPTERGLDMFALRPEPRFLSYLPLSHIAERQLVEVHSMIRKATVTFNESLATLVRDMQAVRPSFFFGAPRVWEQLQQGVIGQFGSHEAFDAAYKKDREGVSAKVVGALGLGECDYALTAAAPTPPALIEWYARLGIRLLEGFGQTEAMGLIANKPDDFRVGSIGKPAPGVEVKISDEEELLVRAEGLSPGYYKMPEKTAELWRDGWLHTGDKARVDADGFLYLTGRVKDYFKTIQGKYVAPVPIESTFADNPYTAQLCLLGRGYSKTVMCCVLSDHGQRADRAEIEQALLERAADINKGVEKHARIGAVIVTTESWTIQNEVLTPTLKIRREQVEVRFGERAERLARQAAEQGELCFEWMEWEEH